MYNVITECLWVDVSTPDGDKYKGDALTSITVYANDPEPTVLIEILDGCEDKLTSICIEYEYLHSLYTMIGLTLDFISKTNPPPLPKTPENAG